VRVAVKVSVVVPVYNPGEHIEDCIASLLRQSLPAAEMEAIFVDDGSTDGSGERLDRLAAEHPGLVSVIHIENSGWPGRPRNLGMDAARGEYVFFADNDDWLGDEALERLYATATRTGADIVLGKVVGHGKGIPTELFRRNRDDARLDRDALYRLLAPHKLFRRAFVGAHGLRFPEGRRRLEDHAFVLPAYFAARRVAILADYPCYHWVRRDDRANASLQRLQPGYFDNLREILDIVEAQAQPPAFRDRLMANYYRGKLLTRVGGGLLNHPEDYRRELYEVIRALALERFGPEVSDRLAATFRVRSRLLVEGRLDGLLALARIEKSIRAELTPGPTRWEDGTLCVALEGTLVGADGRPLRFRREEGRLLWDLPADLRGAEVVGDRDRDVSDELSRASLRVYARERRSRVDYLLPVRDARAELDERDGVATVRVTGEALLAPATGAAGAPLPAGIWDLFAAIAISGLSQTVRVAAHSGELAPPAIVGDPPRAALPYRTTGGGLSLDLDQATTALLAAARPRFERARAARRGRAIEVAVTLPLAAQGAGPADDARLVLRAVGDGGREVTAPARLVPDGAGVCLESSVAFARSAEGDRLGPGTWALSAGWGPRDARLGLALDVSPRGSATIRAGTRGPAPPARSAGRRWRRAARAVARRLRRRPAG
jgi:poly(ribitol-phosphate) beta-N-acetylglucosaminyltransferase